MNSGFRELMTVEYTGLLKMFLSIEEFVWDLLQKEHSIAVLKWKNREKSACFRDKFPKAIESSDSDISVLQVSAKGFDSRGFLKKIRDIFTSVEICQKQSEICLFIADIEEIVPDAGKILNSFREHIGFLHTSVIMVREDEYHDFVVECPDLMDWVGTLVGYVEDLIPASFTEQELEHSIKNFEEHYKMSRSEFIEKYNSDKLRTMHDAWLWKELLEIGDSFQSEKGEGL